MAAEPELILVAPQNARSSLDAGLGKDVVQVHHLVAAVVAHNEEHRPVTELGAILQQGADPAIHLLLHSARVLCPWRVVCQKVIY